jgi:hypothetical protein
MAEEEKLLLLANLERSLMVLNWVNSNPLPPVLYPELASTELVLTRTCPSTKAPIQIPASNKCSIPLPLGKAIEGGPWVLLLTVGLPKVPKLLMLKPNLPVVVNLLCEGTCAQAKACTRHKVSKLNFLTILMYATNMGN